MNVREYLKHLGYKPFEGKGDTKYYLVYADFMDLGLEAKKPGIYQSCKMHYSDRKGCFCFTYLAEYQQKAMFKLIKKIQKDADAWAAEKEMSGNQT